jgi:hypothetical protein
VLQQSEGGTASAAAAAAAADSEQYIAWANQEYLAGRVPPHLEWNADLGMFKTADGR